MLHVSVPQIAKFVALFDSLLIFIRFAKAERIVAQSFTKHFESYEPLVCKRFINKKNFAKLPF